MKYVPPFNSTDPEAPYVNMTPNTPGSNPPADAFNAPMRELVNAIIAGALTPDGADLTQLAQLLAAKADKFQNPITNSGLWNMIDFYLWALRQLGGGALTAHDFGTYAPTQRQLVHWAFMDIYSNRIDNGSFAWNSSTPSQSTYDDTSGTQHHAVEIFNNTWVRNTYINGSDPDTTKQNHKWVLQNTPSTTPAVFSWQDVGIDTVSTATALTAGIMKLFQDAIGSAADGTMSQSAIKAFVDASVGDASKLTSGTMPIARIADKAVTAAKIADKTITNIKVDRNFRSISIASGMSLDADNLMPAIKSAVAAMGFAATDMTREFIRHLTIHCSSITSSTFGSIGWGNIQFDDLNQSNGFFRFFLQCNSLNNNHRAVITGYSPAIAAISGASATYSVAIARPLSNAANLTEGTLPIARIENNAITASKIADASLQSWKLMQEFGTPGNGGISLFDGEATSGSYTITAAASSRPFHFFMTKHIDPPGNLTWFFIPRYALVDTSVRSSQIVLDCHTISNTDTSFACWVKISSTELNGAIVSFGTSSATYGRFCKHIAV